MSERTLKEIALDLLEQYKDAKETVIWEYSGSIDADIKKLKEKVSVIRQGIEKWNRIENMEYGWVRYVLHAAKVHRIITIANIVPIVVQKCEGNDGNRGDL